MEIIVGIIDTLLTCVLICKIYSKICKVSKKKKMYIRFYNTICSNNLFLFLFFRLILIVLF